MFNQETRLHEGSGLQDQADPFDLNRLRELLSKAPPTPTVADELQEALDQLDVATDDVEAAISQLKTVLDSPRATRLARRRGVRLDDLEEQLKLLVWLSLETCKQFWGFSDAAEPLLEAPRGSRTCYGDETRIYPRTPYSGTCGTWGGYQQHRRRGEDCQACRKAAARYNADRRNAKVVHLFDRICG